MDAAMTADISQPHVDALPERAADASELIGIFDSDLSRKNGGNARTQQICELLERTGLPGANYNLYSREPRSRSRNYFLGIKSRLQYGLPVRLTAKELWIYGRYRDWTESVLKRHSGGVCVWEATSNLLVPYLAAKSGFSVIAMPANIESLVSSAKTKDAALVAHRKELDALGAAKHVFTISREEQWLLRLHNISADYLPYYPTESRLVELARIREKRRRTKKEFCLMLGSANYPPTYEGMREVLAYLHTLPYHEKVLVAGFGTERLRGMFHNPNVVVAGALSDAELLSVLERASAVMLHQRSGAGALIRIPEMLCAGIPLISNGIAARSAFDYDGLHVYDTVGELPDWLAEDLPVPPVTARPVKAEDNFITRIKQVAERTP
jgi:hypothetical protein